MHDESLAFLRRLLETPSPSGYEQPVQDIVRRYVDDFADEVRTDLHGNVIASCNPDAWNTLPSRTGTLPVHVSRSSGVLRTNSSVVVKLEASCPAMRSSTAMISLTCGP